MILYRKKLLILFLGFIGISNSVFAQTPGFFKDLFVDSGVYINAMLYMHSAETLDLSIEYLSTSDTSLQNSVIIQNEFDTNGHLLYPDGAPRFRMIHTNGGSALHGQTLGEVGRDRIRDFYNSGGSYTGSCAGAFIASLHWQESGINEYYYHIWPGRTVDTYLGYSLTGHFIPESSPLLTYFDYGGDHYIDEITHEWGCYANEDVDYPDQTESLLQYDYPGMEMHEKISTWAYKPDLIKGRIVVTGSHPELALFGEGVQMMQGMLLYALDGTGQPQVKGNLENGRERLMIAHTEDNRPAFARIGDRQYHHFSLEIPEETENLSIVLDGDDDYNFNLYLNPDSLAFHGGAEYESIEELSDHTIYTLNPSPTTWYVGVECETTVESDGVDYSGNLEVLNGVAYSITATWDTPTAISSDKLSFPNEFTLDQNYPNPFNPTTTINYQIPQTSEVLLKVYSADGKQVTSLVNARMPAGKYSVQWNGTNHTGEQVSTGMYFARIEAGDFKQTIKMIYLR